MSDTLVELLLDPFAYGLATALVIALATALFWVGRTYLQRRIDAGVDHQFAIRLEDHKQSLHLAAESARYHFERELAQANLYTSKGHTAAVEVFQAIRVAHGSCLNLLGLTKGLTFEEFNEKDLADLMARRKVPDGKQQSILMQTRAGEPAGIAELKGYLRMLDEQSAERDLGEAKNATYLNELYFDDATIEAFNRFFGVMDEWMLAIEYPPETPAERTQRPTRKQAMEALEAVHTVLRDRLRGSGSTHQKALPGSSGTK